MELFDKTQRLSGDVASDMDNMLLYASGDVNEVLLKDILEEAHERELPGSQKVRFWAHRRISNIHGWTEYDTVARTRTIRTLRAWFRNMTRQVFDPKRHANVRGNDMIPMIMINPHTGASFVVDIGS